MLRHVSNIDSVCRCGNPIGDPKLVRRALKKGGYVAFFQSVETCANRKCCPTCGPRINRQDAERLRQLVELHLMIGGGAVMYARTVPHYAGETLSDVLDRLTGAAAALGRLTCWKKFRQRWGVTGDAWGLDATYGREGWHPHRHGVLLLERPLEADQVEAFNAGFFACWQAASRKIGVEGVVSDANYATRLFNGPQAAQYVFKASSEALRLDVKEGSDGRTPFRILADFGETGDQDDLDLWHEWEQATYGKAAKFFSPGLLARYGLNDTTDEEAVRAEMDGIDVEAAVLRRKVYLRARRLPGGRLGDVLRVMADGGSEAVLSLLLQLRIWDYNSGSPPMVVIPPRPAPEVPC